MKIAEIKDITGLMPPCFADSVGALENSVNRGHFTAWSVGNSDFFVSSYRIDENRPFSYSANLSQIPPQTIHPYFDLASLTKPFFLNSWLRLKWKDDFRGFLTQKLRLFPWIEKEWNEELLTFVRKTPNLTFDTLLSHKSSFRPWTWCGFCVLDQKTDLVREGLITRLLGLFDGTTKVYSDLNYMLLTLLVESLFGIKNWTDEIANLNKALGTNFFHVSTQSEKSQFAIPSYPYKVMSVFAHVESEKKFGFVHDTNANLFSSLQDGHQFVSGHAGFYGNIYDVLHGAQFLRKTQPFVNFDNLKNRFVYGLDHKEKNFGHLGYTGTSFWFKSRKTHAQPQDDVVLLTNRTARRRNLMKTEAPRACIVTNVQKNEHHYFFIDEKRFEPLSQEEFLKKSDQYFFETQKFWDDSLIFEYQNLNDLRNTIEKQIW